MNTSQKTSLLNIVWDGLLSLQRGIMIATSIAVTLIIFSSVLLRYVFKSDLYGIEEIVAMVALWLYFIGSSYGSFERSQITADILHLYLKKERHKRVARLVTSILTTAIGLLVTYWAVHFFIWGIVMDARSPVYRLPMVIPQSAVFAGFCLMSLYNIYHLIQDAKAYMALKRQELEVSK